MHSREKHKFADNIVCGTCNGNCIYDTLDMCQFISPIQNQHALILNEIRITYDFTCLANRLYAELLQINTQAMSFCLQHG